MPPTEDRFAWIEFYQAVADRLLGYRRKRKALLQGINEIVGRTGSGYALKAELSSLQNISPFTAMHIFNRRHMTTGERKRMAINLADFLEVEIQAPDTLEVGIPFLAPFHTEGENYADDLWNVFYAALRFADSGQHREEFIKAYNTAEYIPEIKWKLSTGLYLVRPRTFLSLDSSTRRYVRKKLFREKFGLGFSSTSIMRGEYYLQRIEKVSECFKEDGCPVHSLSELVAVAQGMPLQADASREALLIIDGPEDFEARDEANATARTTFDSMSSTLLAAFVEQTRHLPRATEAERTVIQRIGQGLFRDALLKLWNARCPLSGISHPQLLRAGHIRPWTFCDTDQERLDVHNGLLLAAHLDAAFDAGLISFEMDGTLIVSPALSPDDVVHLGLQDRPSLRGLELRHQPYLEYHRNEIFLPR